jgi:hypothetical protein
MNERDDLELTVLAETGDIETAEAIGIALNAVQDAICWATGLDPELFKQFQIPEIYP